MSRAISRVVVAPLSLLAGLIAFGLTVAGANPCQDSQRDGERRVAHLQRRRSRQSVFAARPDHGARNFSDLEVAWRFKTDNLGSRPEFKLEGDAADGRRRAVRDRRHAARGGRSRRRHGRTAVGARRARGRTRRRRAPRQLSGRGLAYWTDGSEERILYVTPGYRLIALNAKTGLRVPGFGTGRRGRSEAARSTRTSISMTGEIGMHATPVVVGRRRHRRRGVPRGRHAADAQEQQGLRPRATTSRTGKRLWIFHTIPRPGSSVTTPGRTTPPTYNGNTGVWTQIRSTKSSASRICPVETPTSDYYGGHRPGNNLFAESLVAST